MIICPHSGLGNQIGNYVFGQYLILKGYDVKFLTTLEDGERNFMLQNFNTELPPVEIEDIQKFLNFKPPISSYKFLLKNLISRRRYYFNSLYKVLNRIRGEFNLHPSKSLNFMAKIVSYKDIELLRDGEYAVCDCYSPIEEFEEENFKEKMRNHFTLKEPPTGKNLELNEKIEKLENPVGVHIRRGDYLNLNIPVVKKEFLIEKINLLNEKLDNPEFFIFSDDMVWAKENLKDFNNLNFVDFNDEKTAYLDFALFNKCRHRIYSSSSFSKWVKYLNPYDNSLEFMPGKEDLTVEK